MLNRSKASGSLGSVMRDRPARSQSRPGAAHSGCRPEAARFVDCPGVRETCGICRPIGCVNHFVVAFLTLDANIDVRLHQRLQFLLPPRIAAQCSVGSHYHVLILFNNSAAVNRLIGNGDDPNLSAGAPASPKRFLTGATRSRRSLLMRREQRSARDGTSGSDGCCLNLPRDRSPWDCSRQEEEGEVNGLAL
jgi:hypothetical protein